MTTLTWSMMISLAITITAAIMGIGRVHAAQDEITPQQSVYSESISDYYQRPTVKAAVKEGLEERKKIIEIARGYFKQGNYSEAVATYQKANDFRIDFPSPPFPISDTHYQIAECEEWGDALDAAGRTDDAIQMYRDLIYQPRKLGQWQASDTMAPLSDLPEGAKDIDAARTMFPDRKVYVWMANPPILLARYNALLIKKQQYSEALTVYQRALETYLPDENDRALIASLKSIGKDNFDERRFRAAAQVLLAKGLIGIDVHFGYYDVMGISNYQSAEIELEKAIAIKADDAPANFLLASIIMQQRDTLSDTRRQMAKAYLDKALESARSEELREAIRAQYR